MHTNTIRTKRGRICWGEIMKYIFDMSSSLSHSIIQNIPNYTQLYIKVLFFVWRQQMSISSKNVFLKREIPLSSSTVKLVLPNTTDTRWNKSKSFNDVIIISYKSNPFPEKTIESMCVFFSHSAVLLHSITYINSFQ